MLRTSLRNAGTVHERQWHLSFLSSNAQEFIEANCIPAAYEVRIDSWTIMFRLSLRNVFPVHGHPELDVSERQCSGFLGPTGVQIACVVVKSPEHCCSGFH